MKYRLTKYESVEYFNTKPGFKLEEMATINLIDADPRNVKLLKGYLTK